jgi:hypothetical protein
MIEEGKVEKLTKLLLGTNPVSRLTTIAGLAAISAQILEQYSHGKMSSYQLVAALAAMAFARLTDESWVKNTADRIGARTRE